MYGAELRVQRAGLHLESLKRHLQEWADFHVEHVKAAENPDDGLDLSALPPEHLAEASVLVGEAIYNLRAALDYVVYVLAMVGNDWKPVERTQFPIVDDMADFSAPYLKKLHPKVVLMLQMLQPGWTPSCEWTKKLRDLSNPDKHRHLSALTSSAELRTYPDRAAPVFVVGVFFSDSGDDVIQTLDTLHSSVSEVVELFKLTIKPVEHDIV